MENGKNEESQIIFHALCSVCEWLNEAVQLESLVTGAVSMC